MWVGYTSRANVVIMHVKKPGIAFLSTVCSIPQLKQINPQRNRPGPQPLFPNLTVSPVVLASSYILLHIVCRFARGTRLCATNLLLQLSRVKMWTSAFIFLRVIRAKIPSRWPSSCKPALLWLARMAKVSLHVPCWALSPAGWLHTATFLF